ncbi:type II toxin-antitoxin system RelE/ParE family toxin [Mariniflexile sp.]|uniref:type II toxin-antitoxin system RelE/ParE family toxin n=1 Tax=Mariniflexile sp. TaxID=1979402 RepID=UPI00404831E1
MAKYQLSSVAKDDLIRIHHYGVKKFGITQADKYITQADKYYNSFFEYFDIIAQRPFSFESVDFIKYGYRRCVCGTDSIYFKVNHDIVEIMAIIGRQDLKNIL